MSDHRAHIVWQSQAEDFLAGHYSREHTWAFDGGLVVPASPSPSIVKPPYSNPAAVDPEEAFVAAISSCHMLTFLYLASRQGFEVIRYEDEAIGSLSKNEHGVPWVSSVVLSPLVEYHPERRPSAERESHLHHRAHQECFISNSVKTEISVNVAAR